ncbi:MAG: hypothetical protein QM229_11390, partial [Bacillota bacterium]|nr:hypothetical protein [Bacillota bacterium]
TKKKVLKHGGQVYQFSPYALLWNNDSYYALGFSESHGKVVKFYVRYKFVQKRVANPMPAAKITDKISFSMMLPKDFLLLLFY